MCGEVGVVRWYGGDYILWVVELAGWDGEGCCDAVARLQGDNSARTRNRIIRNDNILKKFTEILPWSAILLSLLGKIFYKITSFLINIVTGQLWVG